MSHKTNLILPWADVLEGRRKTTNEEELFGEVLEADSLAGGCDLHRVDS
jgi:hypothetical protein